MLHCTGKMAFRPFLLGDLVQWAGSEFMPAGLRSNVCIDSRFKIKSCSLQPFQLSVGKNKRLDLETLIKYIGMI